MILQLTLLFHAVGIKAPDILWLNAFTDHLALYDYSFTKQPSPTNFTDYINWLNSAKTVITVEGLGCI